MVRRECGTYIRAGQGRCREMHCTLPHLLTDRKRSRAALRLLRGFLSPLFLLGSGCRGSHCVCGGGGAGRFIACVRVLCSCVHPLYSPVPQHLTCALTTCGHRATCACVGACIRVRICMSPLCPPLGMAKIVRRHLVPIWRGRRPKMLHSNLWGVNILVHGICVSSKCAEFHGQSECVCSKDEF